MQVNLHRKTIDQQLNNALQTKGVDGSVFRWYLALQIDDISQYHAEKSDGREDELPYPSINLPSAPKASLYAQNKHYEQYQYHKDGIASCKNPALGIQLINCINPHSLHWSKHELPISEEVIQNCPLHTQRTQSMLNGDADATISNPNAEDHIRWVNEGREQTQDNNMSLNPPNMPSSFFVDSTLENTAKAASMIL